MGDDDDFCPHPFIFGENIIDQKPKRSQSSDLAGRLESNMGPSTRFPAHRATDSAPADMRKQDSNQTIVRLHRSDPRIHQLPHWSEKFLFSVKQAKRELEAGRRLPAGGVVCKSNRLTRIEGKSVYFLIRSQQYDRRQSDLAESPEPRPARRGGNVSVVRLHRDDPRIRLLPHWSDKFSNSVKLATRVVEAGLRLPKDGVICKSDRLSSVEGKHVFFCLSPIRKNRVTKSMGSADGKFSDMSQSPPSHGSETAAAAAATPPTSRAPPTSPMSTPTKRMDHIDQIEHEDPNDHADFLSNTPQQLLAKAPVLSTAEPLDFPVEITSATFIEC